MFGVLSKSLKYNKKISGVSIFKYIPILMCLKDFEQSESKIVKPSEMEKSVDCPLCLEPLEFDDKNFFPCTCGYQVCRFCWHRIRTNENGLCPACRRTYSENPANFQPLTPEELQKVKHQKKMKDLQKKQKIAENRKQLANIRVIQKNLVFAVGLPLELSQDNQKKEKVLLMFRQFGPTHKEAITDRTSYAGSQGPSACVYITYQKPEDAVRAVKTLNNTKIEGRNIKVSLGTTKYCSNFLKNTHCPKAVSMECLYLHEIADEEASFTKEDIHLGKHLEYEQKLLEQAVNGTSNKIQTNNETNRSNYSKNTDNSSESSDDVPQNSSFYDSSEASELSPANSQSLENNRSIDSDLNLEIENSQQNIHTVNSDSKNHIATESLLNPVFRSSEESTITNNHSTNSSFQSPPLTNNIHNQGFSSMPIVQQQENEALLQQQQQQQQHHQQQRSHFMQNHIFESALQHSRVPPPNSSSESNFLRLISNALSSNTDSINPFPQLLNMKPEHIEPEHKKREDDPDLEFDPCQESLNALQDLLISESREKARIHFEAMNRSQMSNNKSPTLPIYSSDNVAFRNSFTQPQKIRDPPPGFSIGNNPQNLFKTPFESGNSVLNKSSLPLHNQLGIRANFPLQRYQQQQALPLNNSAFGDFSPLISREVQDVLPPLLQPQQHQQQHSQRFINLPQTSQIPPVSDPRYSGAFCGVTQNQARPTENLFNQTFNQSLQENRVTNDFNIRMQQHLRSNEWRHQFQQMNGSVNNLSPFTDLPAPMTSEQVAKVQNMYKALEAAQRNAAALGQGHTRLNYTKKL